MCLGNLTIVSRPGLPDIPLDRRQGRGIHHHGEVEVYHIDRKYPDKGVAPYLVDPGLQQHRGHLVPLFNIHNLAPDRGLVFRKEVP